MFVPVVCLFASVECTTKMSHLLVVHILSKRPIFLQDVLKCLVFCFSMRVCVCVCVSDKRIAKISIFCSCGEETNEFVSVVCLLACVQHITKMSHLLVVRVLSR